MKLKSLMLQQKTTMQNMFVLEIAPRLPQEQANTISKRKQNEIGF